MDETLLGTTQINRLAKSMKICSSCNIEKEITEFHKDKYTLDGYTHQCKQCRNKKKREIYWQNPEKQRIISREWYKRNKEKIAQYNRTYHKQNAERINPHKREYLYQLKIDVIKAYGGCCYMWGKDGISCGRNRLETLTIDHIDQNAAWRRKYDPEHPNRGNIYSWLRSQGYPFGFRVSCMNHNRLAWVEYANMKRYSQKRSARYERKRRVVLKQSIVNILGGCCAICGETDLRVLTLHHPNGDGAQHRAQYGGRTLPLYRDLLKTSMDKWEYEIECRCFNCNIAEEWNG